MLTNINTSWLQGAIGSKADINLFQMNKSLVPVVLCCLCEVLEDKEQWEVLLICLISDINSFFIPD